MNIHSDLQARLEKQAALDALETEITELWSHISAATYRFLELVAEFDRHEAWGRDGVANCAQWLNLRCGIGIVAAREKVRVARALEGLPKISTAFRDGQLSYSKVRAMTRVAKPATEDALLNVALHGTATHVERLVRKYRRAERIEEGRRADAQHRDRSLSFYYDDEESLVIYARLPPEIGALVKKAIEAAMEQVDETLVDKMHEDAARLHGAAQVPVDEAVREPLGARRADALRLLAERYLEDEAERSTSSSDRYQVVVHIDQDVLSTPEASSSDDDRRNAEHGAGCARSEIEDGATLAAETARRLACDSHLVGIVEDAEGNTLNVGRKTRAITQALKRALKSRDGGCRFPGCDRTRFTEGHHVQHWADGGETKLANLVTLCRFHHRLLHEGGYGLRVTEDGVFVFTSPDGRKLAAPSWDGRRFRGSVLPAMNRARGVSVREPPGWCGDRLDYGLVVEYMLSR